MESCESCHFEIFSLFTSVIIISRVYLLKKNFKNVVLKEPAFHIIFYLIKLCRGASVKKEFKSKL